MNAPQTNLKKDTQKAAKLTPMMAQFLDIKADVGPEALLFTAWVIFTSCFLTMRFAPPQPSILR